MTDRTLTLLYKSFDAELSASEQNELDRALADSAELRAEQRRLRDLRAGLGAAGESFAPGFTERTLKRLAEFESAESKPAQPRNGRFISALTLDFRRLSLAGAALTVALALINFWQSGDISLEALVGAPAPSATELVNDPFLASLE